MANSSILLGGQVLHGRDHFGDWRVNKLDGYFETPAVKGESVERENADGEFDLAIYYAARIIPLSGRVLCSGPGQVRAAANRLTGLLRGGLVTMQVTDAGGTTWARVKRNGPTVPVKVNDRMLRFQFDLKAPDPRKYGNTQSFVRTNGTVEVFHRGNFDAHPTIVVRGAAANGYRINGPDGKQYRVSRALVAGVPHRIEFNDGLLRVDGNLIPNGTVRADVWPIPPGQATVFDVNVVNGGTAEATITVTDTYI